MLPCIHDIYSWLGAIVQPGQAGSKMLMMPEQIQGSVRLNPTATDMGTHHTSIRHCSCVM